MKKPPLFIVDASIILAYILEEPNYQPNITLLFERWQTGQCQFLSPTILQYELYNQLCRVDGFKYEEIYSIVDVYNMMDPPPPVTATTFDLMQEYKKISWYDATYHALAIEYGGTFLTADRNYYKATKKSGAIQFIADYK